MQPSIIKAARVVQAVLLREPGILASDLDAAVRKEAGCGKAVYARCKDCERRYTKQLRKRGAA
jgi:hypothetical protein